MEIINRFRDASWCWGRHLQLVYHPRGEERQNISDRSRDECEHKGISQGDEEHIIVHEEKLVIAQTQPSGALEHIEIRKAGTGRHKNRKNGEGEEEDQKWGEKCIPYPVSLPETVNAISQRLKIGHRIPPASASVPG